MCFLVNPEGTTMYSKYTRVRAHTHRVVSLSFQGTLHLLALSSCRPHLTLSLLSVATTAEFSRCDYVHTHAHAHTQDRESQNNLTKMISELNRKMFHYWSFIL